MLCLAGIIIIRAISVAVFLVSDCQFGVSPVNYHDPDLCI